MKFEPNWDKQFPLRRFDDGEKRSWALYSPCEKYRYRLRREWSAGDSVCFIMLNPSTASEAKNDPTVERCERRARRMGFAGFEVVNLFALRSTNPKGLYGAVDPIGAANDQAIVEAVETCPQVIIAWGTHGAYQERGRAVLSLLKGKKVYHLGLTQSGHPKHPLYISYETPLEALEL